jgi:hypothetical protein
MPLQPPARDANGLAVPHDHAEIVADDVLVRRISEQHIRDGRISTMAFQPSTDGGGMSVDIAKLIQEAGLTPQDYVTDERWPCSVFFLAGALRGEGLQVGYDPIEGNPHHGEVWGIATKGQKNRLRALARWFVRADNIALNDND